MTRSEMQWAVIQYTVIITLNHILFHEINRNAYDSVWEDPVVKNFTRLFDSNSTTTNATTAPNNSTSQPLFTGSSIDGDGPFYLSFLPRNTFVCVLLAPLAYYWQIFLERAFPTRPRGVEIDYARKEKAKEKADVDVDEEEEEEIVKRWIAKGRVRRSSVSWWNTFVKWALDLSVGKILFSSMFHFVDGMIRWRDFGRVVGGLKSSTILSFFSQFVSLGPLASVISFVVVPASKRLVFEAGVGTVETVFVGVFFRTIIPWVMQREWTQEMMVNITETFMGSQAQTGGSGMSGRLEIGGPDEL